jgi:hypothetical protein
MFTHHKCQCSVTCGNHLTNVRLAAETFMELIMRYFQRGDISNVEIFPTSEVATRPRGSRSCSDNGHPPCIHHSILTISNLVPFKTVQLFLLIHITMMKLAAALLPVTAMAAGGSFSYDPDSDLSPLSWPSLDIEGNACGGAQQSGSKFLHGCRLQNVGYLYRLLQVSSLTPMLCFVLQS